MADTTYSTLVNLKLHKLMPATGDDSLLQLCLNVAADWIDAFCNTKFVSTTATETLSGKGSAYLPLSYRPVITVTSVNLDGSLIAASEYKVEEAGWLVTLYENISARLTRGYDALTLDSYMWQRDPRCVWPRSVGNVVVVYQYGYAAVPDAIRMACELVALSFYDREKRRDVASESIGPVSKSYLPNAMAPDIAIQLLLKYVQPGVRG